jgi:hypothetical protein
VTIDIVCATYNGARFLPHFFKSLEEQTHADWRVWIGDDGSTDASVDIAHQRSAMDSRIVVLDGAGSAGGAARAFARLLERLPHDARYVMFADQDDVWLAHKLEQSLAAMRRAEADAPGSPVLVHTDLVVVDADLRELDRSFWHFADLPPEPVSVRRFAVRNPVTGAATLINQALLELLMPIPEAAVMHDWWTALVAAAFGRVIALPEPSVLYRQHGANAVGARDPRIQLSRLPNAISQGLANRQRFRADLAKTAAQAGAFLERYGSRLSPDDRRFLQAYSLLPDRAFLRRKIDLMRLRALPEEGMLRRLGTLIRG